MKEYDKKYAIISEEKRSSIEKKWYELVVKYSEKKCWKMIFISMK